MPRRAFTLIELLIVVAVVAVLVAILLPALAGARDAARAGACLTQLRQIDIAMTAYRDAHDRWWPTSWDALDLEGDLRCPSVAGTGGTNSGSYHIIPIIEAEYFVRDGYRWHDFQSWLTREFEAPIRPETLARDRRVTAHLNVLRTDHSVKRIR